MELAERDAMGRLDGRVDRDRDRDEPERHVAGPHRAGAAPAGARGFVALRGGPSVGSSGGHAPQTSIPDGTMPSPESGGQRRKTGPTPRATSASAMRVF